MTREVAIFLKGLEKAAIATHTGADGGYAIALPPDTYNPWALVDQMVPYRFVLADPADAPVTVPQSQQVDFLVVPSS